MASHIVREFMPKNQNKYIQYNLIVGNAYNVLWRILGTLFFNTHCKSITFFILIKPIVIILCGIYFQSMRLILISHMFIIGWIKHNEKKSKPSIWLLSEIIMKY
jgi:hypothetical protein